ncbi:MAG: hypothetical protein FWF08_05195 [Oscillospiraceae bacterium]|nr:hypothetical protein [Oscillospiraceae bacterium]
MKIFLAVLLALAMFCGLASLTVSAQDENDAGVEDAVPEKGPTGVKEILSLVTFKDVIGLFESGYWMLLLVFLFAPVINFIGSLFF